MSIYRIDRTRMQPNRAAGSESDRVLPEEFPHLRENVAADSPGLMDVAGKFGHSDR
jgi:hypothetical protein